jgi:hypothetical protein
MKAIKAVIFVLLISMLSSVQAEAQIWKKIKDKTKSKVENRVSDKISEKVADAIVEKVDVQFKSPNNPYGKRERSKKPENLPGQYSFDWQFKMKITNAGSSDELFLDYYLTSNGNYVGYEMPQAEGMFIVMDADVNSTISYIEQDGNMMALTYSLPDDLGPAEDSDIDKESLIITDLPSKNILGYESYGKRIESDESIVILYYTDEIDMSFSGMFPGFSEEDDSFDYNYPLDMQNASVLYIESTEKKSGEKFIMEGIGLEKTDRVIKNGDYQFF